MKFTAAFLALPLAVSAWKITTGYWESSEVDICTPAELSAGQDLTISELPSNQRVFFFSDDECENFEFSVTEEGTTTLETDVGSFQVLEFESSERTAL